MKKEWLQALANLFICFLAGFAVTGAVYFTTDNFAFIQKYIALLMFASAVVGVLTGVLLDRLFKDDLSFVNNPFGYVFLTGASSTLGLATGILALLLLGAK